MNDLYETKVSAMQRRIYNLPGSAGWIIWLSITWKRLIQGLIAFPVRL